VAPLVAGAGKSLVDKKVTLFRSLIVGVAVLWASAASAWPVRGGTSTAFNNGVYEMQPNFVGIGGDYATLNYLKNASGNWTFRDNQGTPAPDALDAYGYLLPNSDPILNHTGAQYSIRIPALKYIQGNCPNGITGVCWAIPVEGKGTIGNPTTILTSSVVGGTATVTTGATTRITFSAPQAFEAGMEVPISGTSGVTMTNYVGGTFTAPTGTTTAWTVCASGLTTTTIELCFNDQTTKLQTSGTPGGTTVVTYGRNAVGVATNGVIIGRVTTSPVSMNLGIVTQDATTPITYRNGRDGLGLVLLGSEYTRWKAGQKFGAAYRAKTVAARPGVWRHLNTMNLNLAQEVNWADRMPEGYVSYNSQYDRRGTTTYVGTTTSNGNDYSATSAGGGAPTDRKQIILSFDAASVSVTSGAGALVTWTGHGLSTGSPFNFFFTIGGGALPGGVSSVPTTYYAITTCGSCDANTIQFATSVANAVAGTAVTTSSTGTSVLAHATVISTSVSVTASNPNVTWTQHNLSVNDPIAVSGSLPAVFNDQFNYYVESVVNANTITLKGSIGGSVITPATSATFSAVRSPTLNLDGVTYPIRSIANQGVGAATTSYPIPRSAAGVKLYASMVLDLVMGSWQKNGGDVSRGTQYYSSGWPPEVALRDCIEIGAHCWFPMPRYVLDGVNGITDYPAGLAAMIRSTAPSWHIPRYEITNETWNGAADFPATRIFTGHALMYKATAGWVDGTLNQLVGKIGSVMGQSINAAYGGGAPANRYKMMVGVQTFNFTGANAATTVAPRLTATDYIGQSTSPQTGYTKSAASDWVTGIASAQYFAPGYTATSVATTLGAAYSSGVIRAQIAGTTLTLNSIRSATTPAFGIGSVLTQGPGITQTTVLSGGPTTWTIDVDQGIIDANTDIAYISSGSDPAALTEYLDSSYRTAQFSGSISGTTLTVAPGVTGYIFPTGGSGGNFLMGPSVAPYTQITAQTSGTTNKDGTYTVSVSQSVASETMTSHGVFDVPTNNLMSQRAVTFANSYTNQWTVALGVDGYEGGYSPDFTAAGLTPAERMYAAGKNVAVTPLSPTGIYGIVLENAQNAKDAGVSFPSQFNYTGITPASNAWSAIDDLFMPEPYLIIDAYKSINFLLKRDMQLPGYMNDNSPMFLEKSA